MNYNFLSFLISWVFPTQKTRSKFRSFCRRVELEKQVKKVRKHYPIVIKRLKNETKTRKMRVLFLVNEIAKWKCQSLYDLMARSDEFEPVIALTISDIQVKLSANEHKKILKDNYNYFKNKGMNVEYAFDIKKDKAIDLKLLKPDIVFYQQPYSLNKVQDVQKVSKYALTYYVPYYCNSFLNLESLRDLSFHRFVYKFYVFNKELEQIYKTYLTNQDLYCDNILGLGLPLFDEYHYDKDIKQEHNYVIYAPHWSIAHKNNKNIYNLSTFDTTGKFILNYAKEHPEIEWAFKPHPTLKTALKRIGWTEAEINNYYNEWEKIAKCSYSDYTDLFLNSSAMITDCGSFLIEYFYTGKPLIHLISKNCTDLITPYVNKFSSSFYQIYEPDEIKPCLDDLLINKNDYKKDKREKLLKEARLQKNAAKNILNDIEGDIK